VSGEKKESIEKTKKYKMKGGRSTFTRTFLRKKKEEVMLVSFC